MLFVDDGVHEQRDALVEIVVFRSYESGIGVEQPLRLRARQLDELDVGEPRDPEAGQARLLRAEELAGSAILHVSLG